MAAWSVSTSIISRRKDASSLPCIWILAIIRRERSTEMQDLDQLEDRARRLGAIHSPYRRGEEERCWINRLTPRAPSA
jgi:hypothetical protein